MSGATVSGSFLTLYGGWLNALQFYAEGGEDGGKRAYAEIAPSQPKIDRVWPLSIEPGDVIVFEIDEDLSVEQAETLKKQGEYFFPDHKVLVVSGGVRVSREGAE